MGLLKNFSIQTQLEDNWCWAAVAVSVMQFYPGPPFATQCALANKVFEDTREADCCADPAKCDREWDISEVLADYGYLAPNQVAGPVDFPSLQQQIDQAQAPVVIQVQFNDGTDHYMAIIGCAADASGAQAIQVADPSKAAGSSSNFEFEAFPGNYASGCTWENTYFTQAGGGN